MRYKDMTNSRSDARFLDDLGDVWSHVQNLAMTSGDQIDERRYTVHTNPHGHEIHSMADEIVAAGEHLTG